MCIGKSHVLTDIQYIILDRKLINQQNRKKNAWQTHFKGGILKYKERLM